MRTRYLALLMAFTMIIAGVSVSAQEAEGFETDTSTWTVDSGAVRCEKPDKVSEHCVRLTGRDGEGVWKAVGITTLAHVDAEIYVESNESSAVIPEVRAVDAWGREAAAASVLLSQGTISVLYADGDKNTRVSLPVTSGEWIRVTLEMNMEEGTFSVWLDGEPLAVNKKFVNTFQPKKVTRLTYASRQQQGGIYLDNISLQNGKASGVDRTGTLSEADILFDENFDGTPQGWGIAAGVKQVQNPDAETADNLCMEMTTSESRQNLSKSLGEVEGTVTVEADIRVDEECTQIKVPDIYVNGGTQGALVSVIKSNVSVPYFKDGTNVRATHTITLGMWFHVMIQCSTDTDTFSLWVDGEPVVTDAKFYNGVDAKTISSVRFYRANEEDPAYWVDNVRAYKGEAILQSAELEASVTDELAKILVMKEGSTTIYRNNYREEMEAAPSVQDNTVMVPLETVAKAFFADTGLDAVTNSQIISLHGTDSRVTVDASEAQIGGQQVTLDHPAVFVDGKLFASLDTIEKTLFAGTYYNAESGIILIMRQDGILPEEAISEVLEEAQRLYGETLLPEAEIYVSPDASESGDGSKEKPFATIEEAQKKVRALLKEGGTGNITVWLGGGTYYLEKAWIMNQTDSHSGNYIVTYRNVEGEVPLIDGGTRLTGWKPYKNGIYMTQIPEGFDPQTLYENGERVTIARYPNEGYNRAVMSEETPKKRFFFREGDIPVVAHPEELKLYLWPGGPSGHYNWSMARPQVVSIDYTTRAVELNKEVIYDIGTGSRYFAYNALEFLDAPGEYFVDKATSTLYYMPKSSNIDEAVIVMPPKFDLLTISGSEAAKAQNIRLEGLEIRSTDLNKNNIMIQNAQNIQIERCQIYGSGNVGVYMKGNVRNCSVNNSLIYQTGFYGVFIEGPGSTSAITNYGNSVTGCHIHHIGEMNGNAAGVRFTNTAFCYGAFNKINDSPRNAMHLLGQPDQNLTGTTIEGVQVTEENVRDFKTSEYNTFAYNDASRCIQDSQDTNALGAWGIDHGNVMRKNAVHDNILPLITERADDSFWFPYYFDENSNGSYLESNLSYNNQLEAGGPMRAAFHNNGSRDTVVRGNIFADANYTTGVISINDMNATDRRSQRVSVQQNIFSGFQDTIYYFGGWNNDTYGGMDYNTFYSASGQYLIGGKAPVQTLAQWQQRDVSSDVNSIIADPCFVSKETNDYRLKYESPSYLQGFTDINQSDIGLPADFAFADPADLPKQAFTYREGDYFKKAWTTLDIGEQVNLKTDVRTENGYLAQNAAVSYHSDNSSVATVNAAGVVQAIGRGKCNVTTTVQLNGKSVTTMMEIIVADDQILSLDILGIGNLVEAGDEAQPHVTVTTSMGKKQWVDSFTLTADQPQTQIDGNVVTFGASGSITLTATSPEYPGLSGSITVEVKPTLLKNVNIQVSKAVYNEGEIVGYQYQLIDTKGNEMDKEGAAVTLEGDSSGVIAIENGAPVCKKAGMGGFTVKVEKDGVVVSTNVNVAVLPQNLSMPEGFELFNFSPTGGNATAGYAYEEDGRIYMSTSGNDAWNAEDACTVLAKPVSGSQKLTVSATVHEVTSPQSYTMTGAKAIHAAGGVMIRAGNEAGSDNVFVRYRLNGDVIMTYRTKEFVGTSYQKGGTPAQPVEVKLEKDGNTFTGYYKDTNGQWAKIGEVTCEMGDTVYAGIGLQSGVANEYNTAQFSNINIEQ